MERIASFCVDHTKLLPGMYLSRQDGANGEILTWDIRMKQPNKGSYLSPAAAHTLEHLFATYARNSKYSKGVVYVGQHGPHAQRFQEGGRDLLKGAEHIVRHHPAAHGGFLSAAGSASGYRSVFISYAPYFTTNHAGMQVLFAFSLRQAGGRVTVQVLDRSISEVFFMLYGLFLPSPRPRFRRKRSSPLGKGEMRDFFAGDCRPRHPCIHTSNTILHLDRIATDRYKEQGCKGPQAPCEKT